jgi:hypothetical protein
MKLKTNKEHPRGPSLKTHREMANKLDNKEDSLNYEDTDHKNNDFTEVSFEDVTQKFKLFDLVKAHLDNRL